MLWFKFFLRTYALTFLVIWLNSPPPPGSLPCLASLFWSLLSIAALGCPSLICMSSWLCVCVCFSHWSEFTSRAASRFLKGLCPWVRWSVSSEMGSFGDTETLTGMHLGLYSRTVYWTYGRNSESSVKARRNRMSPFFGIFTTRAGTSGLGGTTRDKASFPHWTQLLAAGIENQKLLQDTAPERGPKINIYPLTERQLKSAALIKIIVNLTFPSLKRQWRVKAHGPWNHPGSTPDPSTQGVKGASSTIAQRIGGEGSLLSRGCLLHLLCMTGWELKAIDELVLHI